MIPQASFTSRLLAQQARKGPLCVGIDPHPFLLQQWGLSDDAVGVRSFAQIMVEAAIEAQVASVKPQAAFFERHGSAGVAVLEELLGQLRAAGILTILDAKRGDIGSTMLAYAQSCLAPGSPLEADALTVSPYLGYGALAPAIELAAETQRGVYVLALTSNPEGPQVQDLGAPTVAESLMSLAAQDNNGLKLGGTVGLVIGATVAHRVAGIEAELAQFGGSILCPGVGAQGATVQTLSRTFPNVRAQLVVPISRGLASAGPVVPQLVSAIVSTNQSLQDGLL